MAAPHPVAFAEAAWVWLKIGLLGFGGPAGQIALMHRILVEERRWIGEARFLHALNYCMLLPGPEAMQLATYVGWLLHRLRGGLVAGIFFVLPGFFVILALSALYAGYREAPAVAAAFYGVKAAVLAVVIEALIRIGKRALTHPLALALAVLAFIAIFFLEVPFPLIILGAALLGPILTRIAPGAFAGQRNGKSSEQGSPAVVDAMIEAGLATHIRPDPVRLIMVTLGFGALWLAPVILLWVVLGDGSVFAQIGLFFSKMAVVTFGGAYAVLAYVAQQAVETYGWLGPGEMLDGLGLAETTPGPLILVLEFVGFLAAYREAGMISPMAAGMLGATLTVWVTFVPCFLWIFAGAPYVEALRGRAGLAAALAAITAAVVGVILNLAVWFALHVLFADIREVHAAGLRLLLPEPTSLDPVALVLALVALVALLRVRIGMLPVLAGAALFGLVWRLLIV
ncbi:MAG TPA: chromate efflux transporter [Alphaproteobacteria bacterium]|nr:chromate efflux transporter [Alphaproteobacteria bacterium]